MKTKSSFYLILIAVIGLTLLFTVSCKKSNDDSTNTQTNTVTDPDGNVYHTISIGTQIWMLENLKTTKYNDGTSIPLVTDSLAWSNLTSPGYCWYQNDVATYQNSPYGALYNWFTISTGKLAPTGWRVPTDDDWTILMTYLGGESVAGWKMKETGTTYWVAPNTGATNSSGFTVLPAGGRNLVGGFYKLGTYSGFWSSTEYTTLRSWGRGFTHDSAYVERPNYGKPDGFSVRCLKN